MKANEFRVRGGILCAAAACWIILLSFFLVFSEQRLDIAFAAGTRIYQLAILLLIVLTAGGIGLRAAALLIPEGIPFFERWLYGCGIGLGLLSYLVLLFGMAGLVGTIYHVLMLALLAALCWRQIHETVMNFASGFSRLAAGIRESSGSDRALGTCILVLIIAAVLMAIVGAFTPELAYDSLEYHLGAPWEYIKDGRVHFLAHNVYSNFPSLMEMLFLHGMLLHGETVAKLMHFAMGLLAMAALVYFTGRMFQGVAALVAGALFYLYSQVLVLSTEAYVDLGTAFYSFLALMACMRHLGVIPGSQRTGAGSRPWLLICGILSGLACTCKYPSLLFSFAMIAALIVAEGMCISREKRTSGAAALKQAAYFSLIAFLACCPWYIRNFVHTGNPVYPLLYSIFGGTGWDAAKDAVWVGAHSAGGGLKMFSPWKMTVENVHMSPLFILLLPLIVFIRGIPKSIKLLLGYVVCYYCLWFFLTHRAERFIVPAIPAVAVCCAFVFKRFWETEMLKWFVSAALICFLVLNTYTFGLVLGAINPLGVAFGTERADEYLEREFPLHGAVMLLNKTLGESDRVLFVGEARVHRVKPRVLANTAFDDSVLEEIFRGCQKPESAHAKMKALSVTYILINYPEVERLMKTYGCLRSFDWRMFHSTITAYFTPAYEDPGHGIFIYRIL